MNYSRKNCRNISFTGLPQHLNSTLRHYSARLKVKWQYQGSQAFQDLKPFYHKQQAVGYINTWPLWSSK